MGTDRQQSRVLAERRVNLPTALGLRPAAHLNSQGSCELPGEELPTTSDETWSAPFVAALMAVVDRTIAQWFADNPKHATWRRKCGARVRIVRTGRCSEMCGGSIQKLRRSSLRSFRTIVHAPTRAGHRALSAQWLGADVAGHAHSTRRAAEKVLRRGAAAEDSGG